MRGELRGGAIAGCLALALAGSVCAQPAGQAAAAPDRMQVVASQSEAAFDSNPDVFREIVDPSTGDLWLLLRDPNRPGGPGRMVLVRQGAYAANALRQDSMRPAPVIHSPLIRAGDTVIVEEHTTAADARLEAVALGPAANGAHFKARLKIGGRVVHVVAISPGHAILAPESEVEP